MREAPTLYESVCAGCSVLEAEHVGRDLRHPESHKDQEGAMTKKARIVMIQLESIWNLGSLAAGRLLMAERCGEVALYQMGRLACTKAQQGCWASQVRQRVSSFGIEPHGTTARLDSLEPGRREQVSAGTRR